MKEYQVEGRNPVTEAIKSGREIDKLFVLKDGDGRLGQLVRLAKKEKIVVMETDRRKLDALSKTGAHQGVIALCSATEYASVQDLLDVAAARGEPPLLVLADGVTDPHNLGAIIRTACAAGAHGLIIPKRRSVGVSETVEKVAAGAVEHLKIARVVNLNAAIKELKSQGVWIAGTDLTGEKELYQQDLTGPLGVVIGSEGEGMSRLVREQCDFLVKIPMRGSIQSLNASVASGVILYEILRQREEE